MTAGSHTESWAAHNLRNTEHLSKAGFLQSVATGSFPSDIRGWKMEKDGKKICHFLQKIFGIMFFYGSDSQQWCCFQRVDWNHQRCVTSDITIIIMVINHVTNSRLNQWPDWSCGAAKSWEANSLSLSCSFLLTTHLSFNYYHYSIFFNHPSSTFVFKST